MDAGEVREAVGAGLPGYGVASVTLLGAGLDNVAWEVNGELIVRQRREPDPALRASLVDREARLLAAVAQVATLPVPVPVFALPERGFLGYRKLPGLSLIDARRPWLDEHGPAIGAQLGELLTALHATPAGRWTALADADDQPLEEWLREAAELYAGTGLRLPAVEAFLRAAPPPAGDTLVFSHNDLGIEHVLTEPGKPVLTGVIDWSDAALVDPACDFGLLYRDLGPAALRAALQVYGGDTAALRQRAVFYARCSAVEDLAYGIEHDRRAYVDKTLAALGWLYPGD